MNMSHTAHGLSRFTGIGLVVLIHAVIVTALIHGLMRQPAAAPPPPITLYPDKKDTPPQPPEPLPLPEPTLKPLAVPWVAAPDLPPIATTQTVNTATAVSDNSTPSTVSDGPVALPGPASTPQPVAASGPVNPGAICTRMATPQAPSVNWSGEALFKVVATVRAGRVAATDIRVLRGSFDGRTRRALQSAIDTTLREGYECPGDHLFEQEFNFRIE